MFNKKHIFYLILSIWLVSKPSFSSFYNKNEINLIQKSIILANKKKWQESEIIAKQINDPTVLKVVNWLKFQDDSSDIAFWQIKNFIDNQPNWPNLDQIIRRAEYTLNDDIKDKIIINWFQKHKAKTCYGKKLYANALARTHGLKNIQTISAVKKAWHSATFSRDEEELYLDKFSSILNINDHIHRINHFLWANKTSQAERILYLVDQRHQNLFKVRMQLISLNPGADKNLRYVPDTLKNDQGLLYDLAIWNEAKGNNNELKHILKRIAKAPQTHEKCWKLKARYIRDLIADHDYQTAYNLATSHSNSNHSDYHEAEWLSGWIALRFLNKPQTALSHFTNFHNHVKLPVSLTRAAYWIGRSYESMKNDAKADEWYKQASAYPIHYYGQLATLRLNAHSYIDIPSIPQPTTLEKKNFNKNSLVKAAYILSLAKKPALAQKFIAQAIKNSHTIGDISLITGFGHNIKKLDLSVEASKHASYKKIFMLKHGYPTIKLPNSGLEAPLVYSIIRQESLFNGSLTSHAGAMGLMQVMPETGAMTSKSLNLPYANSKLYNESFNTIIGSNYLNKLVNYYDGSYILAIAAYNGGQGNVNKWINLFGDPRDSKDLDQVIDWIEKIKFHETRNYVQRVLESVQIYRQLFSNSKVRLNLDEDLYR